MSYPAVACSGGCGTNRAWVTGILAWYCKACVDGGKVPQWFLALPGATTNGVVQAMGGAPGPIPKVENGTTFAEAIRAWQVLGHTDGHYVTGAYNEQRRWWHLECRCGVNGEITDEILIARRKQIPPPQEKAVCRCPMLTGGAIIHDMSCPEMPGRGR